MAYQAGEQVPASGRNDTASNLDFSLDQAAQSTPRLSRTRNKKPKLSIKTSPRMSCESDQIQNIETEAPSNISIVNLTWDELEERSYKRKRLEYSSLVSMELEEEDERTTDSLSKLQKKLVNLIQQLDKESRKVAKLVSENPNTKREIKESSLAIRSLLSQMTTETMMTMIKTRRIEKIDGATTAALVEIENKDCQAGGTVMKTTREMATQTVVHSIVKEPKITVKQIREVDSLEDFQLVKNYTWPDEMFRVKHVEASPLSCDRDTDLIVWEEGS